MCTIVVVPGNVRQCYHGRLSSQHSFGVCVILDIAALFTSHDRCKSGDSGVTVRTPTTACHLLSDGPQAAQPRLSAIKSDQYVCTFEAVT